MATSSVEALHDSAMLLAVVVPTVRPPGTLGAVTSALPQMLTPPPPQTCGATQVFGQVPPLPSGPPHLPTHACPAKAACSSVTMLAWMSSGSWSCSELYWLYMRP